MSSPSRAARPRAAKSVTKIGSKAAPAKPVSKPVSKTAPAALAVANGASDEAKRLAATFERSLVDGKLDLVSAEALQGVIAAACRLYTARVDAGEQFTPVAPRSLSATDVMVTASGLLRAVDLAVFELGMWQSYTGR